MKFFSQCITNLSDNLSSLWSWNLKQIKHPYNLYSRTGKSISALLGYKNSGRGRYIMLNRILTPKYEKSRSNFVASIEEQPASKSLLLQSKLVDLPRNLLGRPQQPQQWPELKREFIQCHKNLISPISLIWPLIIQLKHLAVRMMLSENINRKIRHVFLAYTVA